MVLQAAEETGGLVVAALTRLAGQLQPRQPETGFPGNDSELCYAVLSLNIEPSVRPRWYLPNCPGLLQLEKRSIYAFESPLRAFDPFSERLKSWINYTGYLAETAFLGDNWSMLGSFTDRDKSYNAFS
jgi:hypothetical protein